MSKVVTEDVLHSEMSLLRTEFQEEMTNIRDDMNNSFMKLFKYLDKRFTTIDERFERQDQRIASPYGFVDQYAKDVEIYHHEMLARDAQVDRHERWIKQLVDKNDLQLEY